MNFARAAGLATLASLLLAGVVLATIGPTWVGVQIVVVGGLFFGLVVPLWADGGGGYRMRRVGFAGVSLAAVVVGACGGGDELTVISVEFRFPDWVIEYETASGNTRSVTVDNECYLRTEIGDPLPDCAR